MFQTKQSPKLSPEPSGIEIKIKLSEATLIKLIPWVITILLGSSGIWIHIKSVSIPTSTDTRIKEPSAEYEIYENRQ